MAEDNIRIRLERVELPVPKMGEMTAKVNESLTSSINVVLLKKNVLV